MKLFEADGHHYEIGHHLILADKAAEGFDHRRDFVAGELEFAKSLFGGCVPVPGVFESGYPRLRLDAGFVFEKNVVIPVRIKRRIEINEIDAGVRKIIPVLQDLQIVAVVESVHPGKSGRKFTRTLTQVFAAGKRGSGSDMGSDLACLDRFEPGIDGKKSFMESYK